MGVRVAAEARLLDHQGLRRGGRRYASKSMRSPYPLTSVVLDGFTSFASASVELGDLNVLIGPNGAGKSNFLAVFDMLGALVDRRLGVWFGEHGGPSRVLFGGLKRSQELRVTMKFNGGRQGYEAVLGAADGGTVFFVDEPRLGDWTGAFTTVQPAHGLRPSRDSPP
ncbi:MAG: AAA family ATPase [Microthrixaceae bacterium]